VAAAYVTGLQWVLHYYYDGVVSWSWYFPYHYAPLMSDLVGLGDIVISFESGAAPLPTHRDGERERERRSGPRVAYMVDDACNRNAWCLSLTADSCVCASVRACVGVSVRGWVGWGTGAPFRPFEQLMGVLPPASLPLLPRAYWPLMTEHDSPLRAFFPPAFKSDLNGKRNEWEAVVLIPFIDEKRLLAAMAPRNALLTEEERSRNGTESERLHGRAVRLTSGGLPHTCLYVYMGVCACA
jgi:5'-3' exonuclease